MLPPVGGHIPLWQTCVVLVDELVVVDDVVDEPVPVLLTNVVVASHPVPSQTIVTLLVVVPPAVSVKVPVSVIVSVCPAVREQTVTEYGGLGAIDVE